MDPILHRLLNALPRTGVTRYWLAYSGGLDSHALLHAMHGLRAQQRGIILCAVHVHHGLRPEADQWAAHCMSVCAALEIPCQVLHVQARPAAGESPEDAARCARYQALRDVIGAGDCLLTAHHQDDQAETLLLQLLRGAGVAGLAGMPACAAFGTGLLARPLLSHSRAELRAYAERHGLHWVEDGSNAETGYDRNYLRHEILPRLRARWPATAAVLTRSAGHCAAATDLLQILAAQDLANLRGPVQRTLKIDRLQLLDAARQESLKKVLMDMNKVNLVIAAATANAQHGNLPGAWETIEKAYQEFPEDPEVTRLRSDFSVKATEFVGALQKAKAHEERKQTGSALAWFLKARSQYPRSEFASEGVDRIVGNLHGDQKTRK